MNNITHIGLDVHKETIAVATLRPDTLVCEERVIANTPEALRRLELDLPIVGWGVDLHWQGRDWQSPPQKRSQARDPHKLRLNSYRVLLTRGRDGSVLYVPDGGAEFDADYEALRTAGATPL